MITPALTRIMIVPDFGTETDEGLMKALKDAVMKSGGNCVMVADLRKMMPEGIPGGEPAESRMIELAARRLESLAYDDTLVWDTPSDDCPGDPLHDLFPVDEDEDGEERIYRLPKRRLPIRISEYRGEEGKPDAVVVFGKSAMLADGLGSRYVLFIDPVYDREWPWKKQYYAGRKTAGERYAGFPVRKEAIETAYSFGTVSSVRHEQPRRFAIFTDREKAHDDDDFSERYPRRSMTDASLSGDVSGLAEVIGSFSKGKMDTPLLEIDMILSDFPRMAMGNTICTFAEPVRLGSLTALGLMSRVPMANGLSGIRVRVEGERQDVAIEYFEERQELALLRDAVVKARRDASEYERSIPRIMIVPDYFSPHDTPPVLELRKRLRDMGYRVTLFCAGNTLEKSRVGLERVCRRNRYDLIVTLETGCLLAARIDTCDRIYVNPDWVAWEWMKRMLGEDCSQENRRGDGSGPLYGYRLDADEISMAREMGKRYNIRRGERLSAGWFTPDQIDSHLPAEHQERFGMAMYPPKIGLDTDAGITALAKEIQKFIKCQNTTPCQ